MRLAFAAVVLLGIIAGASADVSFPKHFSGRLTCVLPISFLQCTRDWRSGFVAGVRYGYNGIVDVTANTNYAQVCSAGIQNQTSFDMSQPSSIDTANNAAPAWYREANPAAYLYPFNSPITQVIVLYAPNPWGAKFGTIPAILFGYQGPDGLDFAVCGNAKYAQFYLNPARFPAPPTPVTLKAVYTSPLSEEGTLTALGSFEALCSVRGTQFSAYLGGDPRKSSKYFIKKLKRVCFTEFNNTIQYRPAVPGTPPKRVQGHFHCDDDEPNCLQPCHYDKHHNKKHGGSTSYSCAMSGTGIATGKYGAIVFDKHGQRYDWDRHDDGTYAKVAYAGDMDALPEGDVETGDKDEAEEAEEEKKA